MASLFPATPGRTAVPANTVALCARAKARTLGNMEAVCLRSRLSELQLAADLREHRRHIGGHVLRRQRLAVADIDLDAELDGHLGLCLDLQQTRHQIGEVLDL